MDEEGN